MIGKTVTHYEILEQIGRGGMGAVYKARDTRLGRIVALKFLPEHVRFDEDANRRFFHEAKSASELDHPNICTVYEIDRTTDGRSFIAMAYYEGESAAEMLSRGRLALDRTVDIVEQIALGLAHAHQAGIIHRDVKPSNVVVTTDGTPKLVDFGLAKLKGATRITKTGTTTGTLAYMSPEQTQGKPLDQRSDLFSLGVSFYELLTGELPFRGDVEAALLYSIAHDDPIPLRERRADVPDDIATIIGKLLEKDPEDRYQSAEELVADLDRVSQGLKPAIRRKPPSASKVIAATAIVAVVAAGAWLTRSSWLPQEPVSQASFVVAVLPFVGSGDEAAEEGPLMQTLIERELKNELGEEDVRIIGSGDIDEGVTSERDARELGRQLGADVVAWGEVFSLRGEVEILPYITQVSPFQRRPGRSPNPLQTNLNQPKQIALRKTSAADVGDVALLIAGEYYALSEPDKALAILARSNQSPENLVIQAGVYMDAKDDPDKAKAVIDRALAADSTHLGASLALPGILARQGNLPGTMTQFRKVISMYPRDIRAYQGLVWFGMQTDGPPAVLAELEGYRDADATNPMPLLALGMLNSMNGDPQVALEQVQTAIALDPAGPMSVAHVYMAACYDRMGDIDAAIAALERGLELVPDDYDLTRTLLDLRARKLRDAGEFEQALAIYNEQREMDPNSPEIYLKLGRIYEVMGRVDDAIVQYQRVLELVPHRPSMYITVGWMLFDVGRIEEAGDYIRRGVEINPTTADWHREFGEFYRRTGQFDLAVESLEVAVELAPDDAWYRLWLTMALAQGGQKSAARKASQDYLKTHNEDDWMSSLVRFYAGEMTTDALLAKAEVGAPEDVLGHQCEAFYFVGMADLTGLHTAAPDTTAAIEWFEKSVATGRSRYAEYTAAEFHLQELAASRDDLVRE